MELDLHVKTNPVKRKILLSLTVAVALFSCSKKEDDKKTEDPVSEVLIDTTQLTKGKWQLSASTYQTFTDEKGGPVEDTYAELDACYKDDILTFLAGGKFMADSGSLHCKDTYTRTPVAWNFPDSSQLQMTELVTGNVSGQSVAFNETYSWQIDTLNSKILHITNSHDGGTTYRFVTRNTYKHID
jgi:hypothetical protein